MKTNKKTSQRDFIFNSYSKDKKKKGLTTAVDLAFAMLIAALSMFLMSMGAYAQNVGINNPAPHSKSLLDLTSGDKGLLAPRMTQAQRTAMFGAPDATAKGMLVFQTDNTQGFYYYDGANWQFLNSNAGWGLTGNAGTTAATNFIGTTDNNNLVVKTNNVERLRVDVNGNIGIDTIVPQARLHVTSNSTVGFPQLIVEERDSLDFSRMTYRNKGISKSWSTAARINPVDTLSYFNVYHSNNGNLMTVRGDGNVGLGWADPMYPLTFKSTLGDKISLWGGFGNHYGFGIQASLLQIYVGDQTNDIAFGHGSSTALTELMRIKGNGNVGIGTNAPVSRFHVVSNSTVPVSIQNSITNGYSGLHFLNNTGTQMGHMGYANTTAATFTNQVYAGSIGAVPFVLTTSNLERMRIDPVGNVGLGTSNPAGKFHVESNSATGWQNIKITEDGNDFARIGMYNDSTTKFWEMVGSPNNVDSLSRYNIFNSSTGNLFSVAGNGRIGIGNTNPVAPLSFNNNFGDKITLWGSWGNILGFGIQPYTLQMYTGNINDDIVFGYGSSANLTERMRIKGNGLVGIGTSNPLYRLHVLSDGNIPMAIQNPLVNGYSGMHFLSNTGQIMAHLGYGNPTTGTFPNQVFIGSTTSVPFILTANNTEFIRIQPNGDVGVKTAAPTTDFEVNGFTKLGSDAPAIKMKKLTGTTAGTSNSATFVMHGLNAAKILSVTVLVQSTSGNYYPPSSVNSSGAYFDFFVTASAVYVATAPSNSSNIYSRPYRILITYEE